MMPYVPNATDLTRWLAPEAGRTISIGTSAWQPNERAVGIFSIEKEATIRGGWSLHFKTLTTSPKTIQLRGKHKVGSIRPLNVPFSIAKSLYIQTGAMAKVFSERGTSIAVARNIPDVWSMARKVKDNLEPYQHIAPEIELVQRFLETEISPEFELIDMQPWCGSASCRIIG
jgi:hypothetical protein